MIRTHVDILLVEDNPADVRLVEEALKESATPLHLSVTPDGLEALAFLRREGRYAAAPRPDLVLLDLNLPRKSGHEVLAAVKEDPELRRIPVIVLTTSQADTDIRQAYDLHANSYVTKAGDVDRFFDAVAALDHFWLNLVRLPSLEQGEAALGETPSPATGMTILVVDDDDGIVDVMTSALEDRGYNVLTGLGEEALRVARAERPALILLDMNMPGMNGAEVSRRLRDDPATTTIPIIVMSAHAALRDAAALLPGNDRLAKPFELDDLYAAVARWTTAPATQSIVDSRLTS